MNVTIRFAAHGRPTVVISRTILLAYKCSDGYLATLGEEHCIYIFHFYDIPLA
jgi:hypothetical protein